MPRCSHVTLSRASSRRGFTMVEIMSVLVILGLLAAMLVPRFQMARDKGAYSACQENLKNLAVALQTYANDNGQVYPASIAQLNPTYLSQMPTCPGAGTDSYTGSFEKSDLPMCFTIFCRGSNHLNIGGVPNFPSYVFGYGLGPWP